MDYNVDEYFSQISKGNKNYISRALTKVESNLSSDKEWTNELIKKCLEVKSQSKNIGISGPPGAGKSTLINILGKNLVEKGNKIAVLSIDPSSPISDGSILGDKTRMDELSKLENAFIRPSANKTGLGGIAPKTKESLIVFQAAGYDYCIVETVGVGQSEIDVESFVDMMIVLHLAGSGDEIQGIKRGINEVGDLFVIPKADNQNKEAVQKALSMLSGSLGIFKPKESNWLPKTLSLSAFSGYGIDELLITIEEYFEFIKENNYYRNNRANQKIKWLKQLINSELMEKIMTNEFLNDEISRVSKIIQKGELDVISSKEEIINSFLKKYDLN